ncbi:MAG: cytochrome c biogenesis protein [Actinomycetota bacterium]
MENQSAKSAKTAMWKYLLLPWMMAVTVLSYTWLKDLPAFQDPPTARIIVWHVPMAMLGMLWFWVGAVYGARYLFGKRAGERGLDHRVVHANEIGLICTLLATVTGMVFAYRQWGTPWNWDPKQVMITVLIVMYLAYFVLRLQIEDEGTRARISAVYSIIGAVSSVALNYVLPNLAIIQSLHPPKETLTGGLDSNWRTVYMLSLVGFLGITVWQFQLQVRLSAVAERLRLGLLHAPEAEVRTEAVRKPRLEPAGE